MTEDVVVDDRRELELVLELEAAGRHRERLLDVAQDARPGALGIALAEVLDHPRCRLKIASVRRAISASPPRQSSGSSSSGMTISLMILSPISATSSSLLRT